MPELDPVAEALDHAEPPNAVCCEPAPLPVAPAAGGALPPASDFDRFVQSVVQVAMSRGESRTAAVLQQLLTQGAALDLEFAEGARSALVERGFLVRTATKLRATARLETVLAGWRSALSGGEEGLQTFCDETLDEWASQLLGACLACEPGETELLRRQLRKRGVAAFGMRAA
jgi:hypothetical protein